MSVFKKPNLEDSALTRAVKILKWILKILEDVFNQNR